MTTWFTADLHLGHRNIIEYCNRPFRDVGAMNDALIENWNAAVAAEDTVWVLGDFALGKIADPLPLVSKLHGRKILVAGNHDRCWVGHGRRADGWTAEYLGAGFDEVVQGSTRLDFGGSTAFRAATRFDHALRNVGLGVRTRPIAGRNRSPLRVDRLVEPAQLTQHHEHLVEYLVCDDAMVSTRMIEQRP